MNHCAYERQSKPRNIEVKGLYGRWDVQLHATVDGGREYWWVENANGIDGEEGYWTTRNEAGEYEYFCDAGWGDEANAICHLEDAIDDLKRKTSGLHIGSDAREHTEQEKQEQEKCATTS